jgi:hypothetical protein
MATPLFFKLKVRELARALEGEHDSMLQRIANESECADEFDQELMEREFPTEWEKYADIENRLWTLVMELEDLGADEEEKHGV